MNYEIKGVRIAEPPNASRCYGVTKLSEGRSCGRSDGTRALQLRTQTLLVRAAWPRLAVASGPSPDGWVCSTSRLLGF